MDHADFPGVAIRAGSDAESRRWTSRPSLTVTEKLLPTSGEVIGVLIDAFGGAGDLPSAVQYMLSDRTSRRYFNGEPGRRWCCRLSALCLLLYRRGLVRLPPVTIQSKELSKEAFRLCAAREFILWDHLSRTQERRRAYVRYFCLDAIARLFPLLGDATRRSGLFDAPPAWADRTRRGEPVAKLLAFHPAGPNQRRPRERARLYAVRVEQLEECLRPPRARVPARRDRSSPLRCRATADGGARSPRR